MIGWGIFCIFLAFFTMVSTANAGIETGYGAAILWAAIGSVLIARGRAKKQQKQKQSGVVQKLDNSCTSVVHPCTSAVQTPENLGTSVVQKLDNSCTSLYKTSVRASSGVVVGSDGYAVAGVTFRNDDGSSRQDILRSICAGKGRGQSEATLEQYDYNGSPAIRVITPAGCVGNVRRTDVADVLGMIEDPYEAYIEANSFLSEEGVEIYRADLYVDAE